MNPYLRGPRPPFAVVGHRGACGLAPENTLESFELAFDLGAKMVELDVHVTKDGKLVVIHDDRLDRTTTRKGFVSSATLEEIQSADAGTWFVRGLESKPLPPPFGPVPEERARIDTARFSSGKVRVPSLAEVLELVRRRDGFVNVELKQVPRFYPTLVASTVELVRSLKMEERVLLSSFDHASIAEAKKLAPEIPGACLEVSRLHDPGRYVAEIVGADAWNPSSLGEIDTIGFSSLRAETEGARALDRASIESAHARGVHVFVWTENVPDRQRALAALGVDGIITDFPNRASQWRREGASS